MFSLKGDKHESDHSRLQNLVDGRVYALKYDNQGVTHEINGQLYRRRRTTLPWFQHTIEDFWTEMENLVKYGL